MALYDDYQQQLKGTSYQSGGQFYANSSGSGYTPYVDTRSGVQNKLNTDIAKTQADTALDATRLQKSDEATNARSAFAAGKASSQKKLFRGKSTGAYGAMGRLDSANIKAVSDKQQNLVGLESLSDLYSQKNNQAILPNSQRNTMKAGNAISLW